MGAPLRMEETFNLAREGVAATSISLGNVTLESDKFVCVRDQQGADTSILIVDLKARTSTRHKMGADNAIMNPESRILALKDAEGQLQIFDLTRRERVKAHRAPEPVQFWRWISPTTIAFVTSIAVFHWTTEPTAEPVKMFDRAAELAETRILSYRTDVDEQWLMLIGVQRGPDGGLRGVTQLYSVEKVASKVLEGHAGTFYKSGEATVMVVVANSAAGGSLTATELPLPGRAQTGWERKRLAVAFSSPADFPVAVVPSEKVGLLFVVTRAGYVYVFDGLTCLLLHTEQVSADSPIFATAPDTAATGFVGVNTKGAVLRFIVDEAALVQRVQAGLGNADVAMRIAGAAGLAGASELFQQRFNGLLGGMDIAGAIKLAAESPGGVLRTQVTLQRLMSIQATPGQQPPVMQYFRSVMEKGRLNPVETVELARMLISSRGAGAAENIKKLMDESKVETSPELGDLVAPHDATLALQIFHACKAHDKVLQVLCARGDYAKVVPYCQKYAHTPNWMQLIQQALGAGNADGAVQLAIFLHEQSPGAVEPARVVDALVGRNCIQQVTTYLLDVLKGDRDEDAQLQTRLLETNLMYSPPQVTEEILKQELFSKFDMPKIAMMCEKAQLYPRALQMYAKLRRMPAPAGGDSRMRDLKRVIVNTHAIPAPWLVDFFANVGPDDCLELMGEILGANPRVNFNVCVQIATRYADVIGPKRIVDLFARHGSYEGIYYFLSNLVNTSTDPEVHYHYIEAALRLGQLLEVSRVTRESNFYDPERVKALLKEARLADPWPMINVCDKHNMVPELVKYLSDTNNIGFVDQYVQKSPNKLPEVVAALLDQDDSDSHVRELILGVGGHCPAAPLVEVLESRNRLRLLAPWLEARAGEGSTDPAVHNALGKILVDGSDTAAAEKFLAENAHYEPVLLGKYCENRDPAMACVAYRRGKCDDELIAVTSKYSMFKDQARYLVKRQDAALWAKALAPDNPHRDDVVRDVVNTALPETKVPDEVSTAVKAFMAADMPHALTELLEKIVLHGSPEFRKNKFLQNLLLLTAVRADPTKVMDYVERLENYDEEAIAAVAIQHGLFEQAFAIYKKAGGEFAVSALRVLVANLKDLPRAASYAERINQPPVWSALGQAYLDERQAPPAIDAFIRAEDPGKYDQVIAVGNETGAHGDVIRFLKMCRAVPAVCGKLGVKMGVVDTEMVFSLAKTNRLAELEEFVSSPNTAQLLAAGERLYQDKAYEAARILFQHIGNYARLAGCLVHLGQFALAVEAAQRANSMKVWPEVCYACVDAAEFRLAQMCALNIIIHADHLEGLVRFYEERGLFDELIACIKAGLGHERAHSGMFTELGVLYAKYKPEQLIPHIKMCHQRITAHRLIRVCEQYQLWAAARLLHTLAKDFDAAVRCMLEHNADAWTHETFKETIAKATPDLAYQGIRFYVRYHADLLNDFLVAATAILDPKRVVDEARRAGQLPLIRPYLEAVQSSNVQAVNEALHELQIAGDEHEALRASVDAQDKFDQLALAAQLEKHDLMEFRRVAALLYKRNGRWRHAVLLSQRDKMYKDAMDTAAESGDAELVDEVLRFFAAEGLYECMGAALYSCYDLVRPDVAIELAWRHKVMDYAMPYVVQLVRDGFQRLKDVETKLKEMTDEQAKFKGVGGFMGGGPPLAIMPPGMAPPMMPPQY